MKSSLSKIIGIYKITSPSGRVYIGQTRDYDRRLRTYKNLRCKKQPRLYNSLIKYEFENHSFEIIEECGFEQLNIRERYWQDFYNVLGKNGLNCYLAETHLLPKVVSEETRKKMGEWQRGELNNMWGKTGERNPFFGKKHSEENKLLMRRSKLVLNLETGIYYDCGKEASDTISYIKCGNFRSMLRNDSKNKTNFIYC